MSKASNKEKATVTPTAVSAPKQDVVKNEVVVATDSEFVSNRRNIAIRPYVVGGQEKYLPLAQFSSIKDKGVDVDKLFSTFDFQHVIYNHNLFLLIGRSSVNIDIPENPNASVSYLDSEDSKVCSFSSLTILVNSSLILKTDNHIRGVNLIQNSTVSGDKSFAIEQAIIQESCLNARRVLLENTTLAKCKIESKNIHIVDSRILNSELHSSEEVKVTETSRMRDFKIGTSDDDDSTNIENIEIQSPNALLGGDNAFSFNLNPKKGHYKSKMVINRRIDFCPVSSANGAVVPTARAGDMGIYVGRYLFTYEDMDTLNNNTLQDIASALFGEGVDYDTLPNNKLNMVNGFIDAVKSRLNVYKTIADAIGLALY